MRRSSSTTRTVVIGRRPTCGLRHPFVRASVPFVERSRAAVRCAPRAAVSAPWSTPENATQQDEPEREEQERSKQAESPGTIPPIGVGWDGGGAADLLAGHGCAVCHA